MATQITSISDLVKGIGLGARPNLFRISFTSADLTAANFNSDSNFSFLCKAGQVPASSIGIIDVPLLGGRRYKIGGDRSFADWTVTVMVDGAMNVRKNIEDYQALFVSNDYSGTLVGDRSGTELTTVTVEHLGADDTTATRTYSLINCWPSDISTIDLSYDTTDSLEEFTVTWSYDYFTVTS
jgi:hypothetical protein